MEKSFIPSEIGKKVFSQEPLKTNESCLVDAFDKRAKNLFRSPDNEKFFVEIINDVEKELENTLHSAEYQQKMREILFMIDESLSPYLKQQEQYQIKRYCIAMKRCTDNQKKLETNKTDIMKEKGSAETKEAKLNHVESELKKNMRNRDSYKIAFYDIISTIKERQEDDTSEYVSIPKRMNKRHKEAGDIVAEKKEHTIENFSQAFNDLFSHFESITLGESTKEKTKKGKTKIAKEKVLSLADNIIFLLYESAGGDSPLLAKMFTLKTKMEKMSPEYIVQNKLDIQKNLKEVLTLQP